MNAVDKIFAMIVGLALVLVFAMVADMERGDTDRREREVELLRWQQGRMLNLAVGLVADAFDAMDGNARGEKLTPVEDRALRERGEYFKYEYAIYTNELARLGITEAELANGKAGRK